MAALSGPTFAEGVARGDPTAAVVAGGAGGFALELQYRFSTSQFRLYTSEDLVGVELCGALKNVVAIAAGIVSGLGFGHNTLAALVTRGLAEIDRLVRAQGGRAQTVHGLAGVGDLMLTCTGQQSRNRRVGEEIGRGRKLSDVLRRACRRWPRGRGRASPCRPWPRAPGSRRRSPRRSSTCSTKAWRRGTRSST